MGIDGLDQRDSFRVNGYTLFLDYIFSYIEVRNIQLFKVNIVVIRDV